MYDSTLPLAVRMGDVRLGEASAMSKGPSGVENGKNGEKGEVSIKRRFPEEEEEEMLRETNDRFVLFPIRYHEVGRIAAS